MSDSHVTVSPVLSANQSPELARLNQSEARVVITCEDTL